MRSACIDFWVRKLMGLALLTPFAGGCASDHDIVEKQLAKLQEEVTRLQSETDRMGERLDAVEVRQTSAPGSDDRVASVTPASVARPKLKVVRVEPDGDLAPAEAQEPAPADEGGPRVVIQGEGKALESRTLPGTAKPKAEPGKASAK